MTRLLVSIDVGGTLGHADGPSLATRLVTASPLDRAEARDIIREKLYPRASIDVAVIADVCAALQLPTSAFPSAAGITPLRLVPGARAALSSMSRHARLVTLSNVTSAEADTDRLHTLLYPWVLDHFPSSRIGYAKPDPAAFHRVADECGTNPAHMVHIGDDWACDVVGARSAGITAVWVSRGRPVPQPERLTDVGLLVAADLAAASKYVADLATWRRS
jgi:FMN phosphatase YigB (HAD superfamily)